MVGRKTVRLHYDEVLQARALKGSHNFTNVLRRAFQSRGFDVDITRDTRIQLLKSQVTGAYTIMSGRKPLPTRSLVMRRAYVGAFWQLETTHERWNFAVAQRAFDPDGVDPDLADRFMTRWQTILFKDGPASARRGGFVLVPLQAKLLDRRSFQAMAPLQMLEAICTEGPDKPIVATLHPEVDYSEAELSGVARLVERHNRLSLSQQPSIDLLRTCDMVACQNSAVAFNGFFFRKPAVLFSDIDFHHIAGNVRGLGVGGAFREADEARPDYARYLYWFLKLNTIGAGQPDAEEQVVKMVSHRGWEI